MASPTLLATGGYDNNIRFWEVATGIPYRTIQFTDSHLNRIKFSPDRLFLTAAGNPRVCLFDVASSNPNPFYVCEGHKGNVLGIDFLAAGRNGIVTCSDDSTIKVWDTRDRDKCIKTI